MWNTEINSSWNHNIYTYKTLRITLYMLKSPFPVLRCYLTFIFIFLTIHWTFTLGCVDVAWTSVCSILHVCSFFPKPGYQGSLPFSDLPFTQTWNSGVFLNPPLLHFSCIVKICCFFFYNVLTFIISSPVPFLGFKLGTVVGPLHLPAVWFPQNLSLNISTCPVPLLTCLIHIAFRALSLLPHPTLC